MNNKVLIITNEFIPYSKSLGGVIRILSLSNFLIKNNFEVHLITSKSIFQSYYGYEDIYKKINIHFINTENNSTNFFFNKINFLIKIIKKILVISSYNFYHSLICFGLDQATLKLGKYSKVSQKIITDYKISNVIISSPPFSLFLISKYLKYNNTNLNIIHDYRDSWTLRFDKNNHFLKKIATKYIERKTIKYVNYIVCASESIAEKIKNNFNSNLKNNPLLVFNGYHTNSKNIIKKTNILNNKKINIGYFGMINDDSKGYRDIKIVYDKIKSENKILNNYEFHFYGPSIIKNKEIKTFKIFHFYNTLNHLEALKKMYEMDYLLLIHTEESTASEVLTGKIFDYIYVKKPIIIISKGITEAGRLIKKFNIGYNIDINNTNLSETLINLINIKNTYIKIPDNIYDSFSRDYQNKKYLKILNE